VQPCKAVVAEPASSKSSPAHGPVILDGQVLHSLSPERLALVSTLGPFVEAEVSPRGAGSARARARTHAHACRPGAWARRSPRGGRGRVPRAPRAPRTLGRPAGGAAAQAGGQVLAAGRLPAALGGPLLPRRGAAAGRGAADGRMGGWARPRPEARGAGRGGTAASSGAGTLAPRSTRGCCGHQALRLQAAEAARSTPARPWARPPQPLPGPGPRRPKRRERAPPRCGSGAGRSHPPLTERVSRRAPPGAGAAQAHPGAAG
jgi:hypothetical protein